MRECRIACWFLLVLLVAPGCQALYLYRPMTALVLDAETKQPIAGAEIHVSYPLMNPSQAPFESTADTAANGVAYLRAAPSGPAGVLIEVKAKGYLYEQRTLSQDTVQNLKMAALFEDVHKRPADLTIEMYAAPRPVVELVLPTAFRGLIQAALKVQPNLPHRPGERIFRYRVAPTGAVDIVGPPLVERVQALDYRAVASDGTPVRRDAHGPDVGFYALKSDEQSLTFFVGTRAEFEALRHTELLNDTGSHSKQASGGGRRGGGLGKRNAMAADPTGGQ